jgi:hypothetical protein
VAPLISGVTFPDLATEVVGLVAPQELELLPEVTAAWLNGQANAARTGSHLGGSVGFGVGPELLCSVVYPVLTGAFAQVLGTAALGWRPRRAWWRRRPRPRLEVPPLDADQAAAVRAACLDSATAAGLSARRAALLADAVYGRLLQGVAPAEADR